jgi:N-methylhydantoinase A/oxoprolinase/acetone carboxylase beta subunit
MRRLFFIMGLLLILIVPQAWGSTQYPNPYRQTTWNSLTDKMHTLGQSPRKTTLTKMKLHNARTRARIKSINQAKRQSWLKSHNLK